MPQSADELRAKFNSKLREIVDQKGQSSRHLSPDKYKWIVNRLDEFASNPTSKKSTADYRLLKRYELLILNIDGATTKKLREKGSERLYVSTDRIFDAIHTEHLSAGHGARDITHVKVGQLYGNISRELELFMSNYVKPAS